jgi:3-aminobutyryl-CoA ammonia-lyase
MAPLPLRARLRLRMSQADAHYGGDLVDGARLLALFGDLATELLVRHDGDEGLFRAYDAVEFLAPVHAGDFLEAEGELVGVGATSRAMRFEARKVIASRRDLSSSAAEVLATPVVVCRATGTCVVPREQQRLPPPPRPPTESSSRGAKRAPPRPKRPARRRGVAWPSR